MFFDPLYILITLPALLIGLAATFFLRFTYGRYKNVMNINHKNGLDTVAIVSTNRNYRINVETIGGDMSDHYNPLNKTVSLSNEVAHQYSIASVGIAAHELGHVDQHNKSFILMSIRTTIAPIIGIGSNVGYFFIVFGLILGFLNLSYLGLILFAGTTLFSLITLPIEIDASLRGIAMIRQYDLIPEHQMGGVKMVLIAAAMTYVAATLQSLSQLLYFFLRIQGSSRD